MGDLAGNYNANLTVTNNTSYPLKLTGWSLDLENTEIGTATWRSSPTQGETLAPHSSSLHVAHISAAVSANGTLDYEVQGRSETARRVTFFFQFFNDIFGRGWTATVKGNVAPDLSTALYVDGGGSARSNPATAGWTLQEYAQP